MSTDETGKTAASGILGPACYGTDMVKPKHPPLAAAITLTLGLTLALALGGCSADTVNYPSLARRPIERISGSSAVVPGELPLNIAPAQPSPELVARLGQLLDSARAADAQFKAREARASGLTNAAAGTTVASESWAVATIALADLESARSNTMIALADLDALYAATRVSGGELSAITATRDRVIGLVRDEDRVLLGLRDRLAS